MLVISWKTLERSPRVELERERRVEGKVTDSVDPCLAFWGPGKKRYEILHTEYSHDWPA